MRTRKPPPDPDTPSPVPPHPKPSPASPPPPPAPTSRVPAAGPPRHTLRRAAHEFGLTGLLLFLVVTAMRWLLAPDSPTAIGNPDLAPAVLGALIGVLLTSLILSPSGRYSGGHLNPAVTVALWLLGAFPGRAVLPYIAAQAAGSLAGTALGGLVWGANARHAPIAYAVVGPAPTWNAAAVLAAEAGAVVAVTLMLGAFLRRPSSRPLLPYAVGLATALIIASLGPRSGGSANPARQLGPALLSGNTTHLWIYLLAPVIGAFIGGCIWHTLAAPAHRARTRHAPDTDSD
ncbi:aquaporin [Streptomyces sp. NBC_01005]|uniref:MIP/aquaporin family protein n=1 Tax=unclassified Streptomyces TaxID=2593676 RepID=UPI002E348112|nr:aquaporin [Streptomyces sp. NBC_01362]WSW02978.1 aquaporin [Streptomyces sp. NBC_01005]WTC92484.1 aquaporin [Streptomyces sp. NBC_01650]